MEKEKYHYKYSNLYIYQILKKSSFSLEGDWKIDRKQKSELIIVSKVRTARGQNIE